MNHYGSYDWAELVDLEMDGYASTLGWSQANWDGEDDPPLSDGKKWDDLTDEEKTAADRFCYFYESWDGSPLDVWQGRAWPEWRFFPWSDMAPEEQELMREVGYTEDTWNNLETADFEGNDWDSLDSTQRDNLRAYGSYQAQWNCYVNHYMDYDWFDLVLEEVVDDFLALGWTQDTWSNGPQPASWDTDWDDLTGTERSALWNICYFREVWDEKELPNWDSDVRSGSGAEPEDDDYYSDGDEEDDFDDQDRQSEIGQGGGDDGLPPGVMVLFVLLALLAGFACGCFAGGRKSAGKNDSVANNNNPKSEEWTEPPSKENMYDEEFVNKGDGDTKPHAEIC